jgi:hypothetical protein
MLVTEHGFLMAARYLGFLRRLKAPLLQEEASGSFGAKRHGARPIVVVHLAPGMVERLANST